MRLSNNNNDAATFNYNTLCLSLIVQSFPASTDRVHDHLICGGLQDPGIDSRVA